MQKIKGYGVFISSGGNTCVQCGVRMRKGLPYMSPVKGVKTVKELKGKSICITCIEELTDKVAKELKKVGESELDKYNTRRFMEHFDKET